MNTALTEEQRLLQEVTRGFLEASWPSSELRDFIGDSRNLDRTLWARVVDLGWTSILLDGATGQISRDGAAYLAILAEETGRSLFPGPVIPTNVALFALARDGTTAQLAHDANALADGTKAAAIAIAEAPEHLTGTAATRARPCNGGFRVSGCKAPVQDAHLADYILVSAHTSGGITEFLVDATAPGVTITCLAGMDLSRTFAQVSLDEVYVAGDRVVGQVDGAEASLTSHLALAVVMQCAETIGAASRAFDMTIAYMKERRTFGRQVASYQALKHRLADMLLWLESSKSVTSAAVSSVDSGGDSSYWASLAKSYVASRCPQILRECMQMHGGIGYTWEHDIHLLLRKVESNAAIYGNVDYHLDRLCAAVGLRP